MEQYQRDFIDFLIDSDGLTFGDFTTKSGRQTPYFINTGKFNSGFRISRLGEFYATHLKQNGLLNIDTVFGPAYKGVPLCVATSSAAHRLFQKDLGYTFNRKEAKEHGDKGAYVGFPISDGATLVIVEDVVTAGTTLKDIVPELRTIAGLNIAGVVIAVDRCERGAGEISAVKEVEEELAIQIHPMVTIYEILEYLRELKGASSRCTPETVTQIESYLSTYGVE